MARKPTSPADATETTDTPVVGTTSSAGTITVNPEMEALKAQLAEQQRLIQKLLDGQKPVSSTDVLAQKEHIQRQRDEQFDAYKKWAEQSNQEKTQEEADRRFPDGARRYRVRVDGVTKGVDEMGRQIPGSKVRSIDTGCPTVEINAHSPHHAQGNYMELCGILGFKDGVRVVAEDIGPATPFDAGRTDPRDLTPPKGFRVISA